MDNANQIITRYIRGDALPEDGESLRFYTFEELDNVSLSVESLANWTTAGGRTSTVCMFVANGSGSGDMTPSVSFNVANYGNPALAPLIERVSSGLYRVVLQKKEVSGREFVDRLVESATVTPAVVLTTNKIVKMAYVSNRSQATGSFDINTYELGIEGTGASSRVVAIPTDLDATEVISFTGLYCGEN